jgi:hypothetical protein
MWPVRAIRLAMFSAVVQAAVLALISTVTATPSQAEEVKVLFRQGALFVGEKATPLPPEQASIPAGERVRAGPELTRRTLEQALLEPPASSAALLLGPGRAVTLSTGASIQIVPGRKNVPDWTLSGAVHVLLESQEKEFLYSFSLGGIRLETSRAHLFYNGFAKPARLAVIEGRLRLTAPPPAAKPAGEGAPKPGPGESAAAPMDAKAGDWLVFEDGLPVKGERTKRDEQIRRWSELPGFNRPGAYNRVGEAHPSDGKLSLLRYGELAELTGKAIPLMEGDEVRTHKSQEVLLKFDNRDRIKLFRNTTFHIQRHPGTRPRRTGLLFSLFGKIRALLVPRKASGEIRFETTTAVIGVKGTDFESIAATSGTEVSVVDGLLGVANPAGLGEVDVPAGMFTAVVLGQLPTPPAPIPPARMERLRSEAIPAESIRIESPQEGQVLRTASLAYAVIPPGAPVEVLLDGNPIAAPSGSPLPTLPDGTHRVTVKAAGLDEPAQTVTYILDTRPPAPAAGVNLAALTFNPPNPLVIQWQEPLESLEVKAGETVIPSELSPQGVQATLTPGAGLLKPGIPLPVRIRAVDRAGNEALLEGALILQPAQKPKPPEPATEKAKPESPKSPPIGKGLRARYEHTLAGETGMMLDRMYLVERGPFFETPGFGESSPPQPPTEDLYPQLPPYDAELLRMMDDPFFHHPAREGP